MNMCDPIFRSTFVFMLANFGPGIWSQIPGGDQIPKLPTAVYFRFRDLQKTPRSISTEVATVGEFAKFRVLVPAFIPSHTCSCI